MAGLVSNCRRLWKEGPLVVGASGKVRTRSDQVLEKAQGAEHRGRTLMRGAGGIPSEDPLLEAKIAAALLRIGPEPSRMKREIPIRFREKLVDAIHPDYSASRLRSSQDGDFNVPRLRD